MTRTTPLHIATAAAEGQPASPEHRRFKTLLSKIEAARARLAAWHEALPKFSEAHRARVLPELERLFTARRTWALELGAIALGSWSKADRETLERMVVELAGSLLESRDPDEEPDPEIKALYNRYAPADFDSEGREQLEAMKAMMESMGGIDLGDEPADSMDELMRRAQADMARRREAGAEAGSASADGPPAGPGRGRKPKPKAKTAAERRAEEDAQRATQTVREVYRKLAAALHPDRVAPDASAEERAERTALMQRANSAYEAGDLLALLSLQLQIEQVDVAHAAQVAASQVRHFNKVLTEQLSEIEAELVEREMMFCTTYGLAPMGRLDPKRLGPLIGSELRELAQAELMLHHEQRALRGDVANARRWLKQQRGEFRFDDQMSEAFDDSFGGLLSEMVRTGPKPRRGGGRR